MDDDAGGVDDRLEAGGGEGEEGGVDIGFDVFARVFFSGGESFAPDGDFTFDESGDEGTGKDGGAFEFDGEFLDGRELAEGIHFSEVRGQKLEED